MFLPTASTARRSTRAAVVTTAVVALLATGAVPASAAPARDLGDACDGVVLSDPFLDIDDQTPAAQLAINCLFEYGVTMGTRVDNEAFTPQRGVTRLEMALFLEEQVLYGLIADPDESFDLPEISDSGFEDIGGLSDDNQFAINTLFELGITTGRSADAYAPSDFVTRAEMARYVNRTQDFLASQLGGGEYTATAADKVFVDVAVGQPAADDIYSLQGAGIVEGTGPRSYSPNAVVTRNQMAFFLMRNLDENVGAGRLDSLNEVLNPAP